MDILIKNIKESSMIRIQKEAQALGIDVGTLISLAIDYYLFSEESFYSNINSNKKESFRDLPVFSLGKENQYLSREVDKILFE